MIRLYQVILLCYISLIVFLLVNFGEAKVSEKSRPKRFLSFRNVTHFFVVFLCDREANQQANHLMLRLNFRANMVPWNQIFAQALGFRMNWDDPPDSFHPYHHLQRRTVYNNLEILMDRNGLNGFHCIRRAICEMNTIKKPKAIYHIILKLVFGQRTSETDKWHNVTTEECQQSLHLCPLSVLDVSLYTDI